MIRDGRLRGDLYYRLAVVTLTIPPLRDRPDDIALLATRFLERATTNDKGKELTPAALRRLMRHDWPGNVRELSNVIERAALLARGSDIDAADLQIDDERIETPPTFVDDVVDTPAAPGDAGDSDGGVDLTLSYDDAKRAAVDRFQHAYLESLLAVHEGNISAASAAAGMTRAALHRILKRWHDNADQEEGT